MSRETCLGCRRTVTTTGEPTDQAGLFLTNQRLDEVDAHGVAGVRDLPLRHATMWRAGALHIALCSDCQARIRDGLDGEIDRLRALPVLATCGACGWSRTTVHSFCRHPKSTRSGEHLPVTLANEPPADCPLRGGAR